MPPCSGRCRRHRTIGRCTAAAPKTTCRTAPIRASRSICFPNTPATCRPKKRALWNFVSDALRAPEVQAALVRKLAPGLARRFGDDARVGLYPVPVLTRDIAGYLIKPHPDTRWKGITVQLYLPPDDAASHAGTILHGRDAEGRLTRHTRMTFAPNTGYAFAVDEHTWHSADPARAGDHDAGFDSAHLLRRRRSAAHSPQSRQAARQFPAQRVAVLDRPMTTRSGDRAQVSPLILS